MLDILKKRRSIRRFKDEKVEKEKIDSLIKVALLSPSSKSIRPWEFIVVTNKELLETLSNSKQHGSKFLKRAPLGIVVVGDPGKSDVWVEDASIASIDIQLAAETIGLGSCWIQIRNRMHSEDKSSDDYIKEVLEIPGDMSVESIIAIGYPDESKKPYTDQDLMIEKIHMNKFGKVYEEK